MRVLGPNDKIISGLAAASALSTADLVPVVQGGATKKATIAQVSTLVGRTLYNAAVATVGPGFAADTYLTGSEIAIPAGALQAKTMYRAKFSVAKTGAGTAAPVITVRFGTAGTVADASRCAFTFPLQTAVVDEGLFEVFMTFRAVGIGTTAVLSGAATLVHDKGSGGTSAGVGLSVESGPLVGNTGAGFDSTVANSIIGLSVNGGTSAAWTIPFVQAELINLA